jgi:7,8-dihydropterin-6-yl-methyl-4-(beta-D-ribofuranosyl)aminobenzene 5'-phosphate synthase
MIYVNFLSLVEDETDNDKLCSIHGVSFLITLDDGYKLLFDTGQKDVFIRNSKILSADPFSSDVCVISHNHYDHSGGLIHLINGSFNSPIYVHEKFLVDRFSIRNGKLVSSVGIDSKLLDYKKLVMVKDSITKIHENVYILANVNLENDFEAISKNFVVKKGDDFIQDNFEDEISLIIDSEKGLIIISGCSHRGMINILNSVKRFFDKNIYAFIGGTHLIGSSDFRLSQTVKKLNNFDLKILGACHCTGDKAMKLLSKEFKDSFVRIKTGTYLTF